MSFLISHLLYIKHVPCPKGEKRTIKNNLQVFDLILFSQKNLSSPHPERGVGTSIFIYLLFIYLILILAALGLGCFALTFSNLPGPEIKPMSPVLAGGLLSAMLPGKSDTSIVPIPVLSQMGLPVSSI